MTYVDTNIIANLLKNYEHLTELLNNVMVKAMGEIQVPKETKNLNQRFFIPFTIIIITIIITQSIYFS